MNLINKFISVFGNLRNAEHADLNTAIYLWLRDEAKKVDEVELLKQTYIAFVEEERRIFKPIRAMKVSLTLGELDRVRDNLDLSFQHTLDAASYGIDPKVRIAATTVGFIYSRYRKIRKRPYKENSALIDSLLQDLKKDDYFPSIQLLHLEDMLDELMKANKEFFTLFYERADQKEEAKKNPPLKAVRRKVDESLQALSDAINMLVGANALGANDPVLGANLGAMVDKINGVISQAKDDYYRRVDASRPAEKPVEPEVPGDKGPYLFYVTEQTTTGNGRKMELTDRDPAAFRAAIEGLPLEGAKFYFNAGDMEEGTPFTFRELLTDDKNAVVGLVLDSTRMLHTDYYGGAHCEVALAQGSIILMRFFDLSEPLFVD